MINTLEPTDSEYANKVRKPDRPTEFDVHAWLYIQLKDLGYDVNCQVSANLGRAIPKGRRGQCWFDIAVFQGEKLVEIIEVKAAQVTHKDGVDVTRQCIRYRKFGVPLTYVYGMQDAIELVRQRS